jgi:dihydrofolate synthase/folylpolyglutamate synthase
MGGRLDATNIIDPPEAAVITAIGFDHMQYLGDTIEKITFEKRGIIKPGSAVVEYSSLPLAEDIVSSLNGSEFTYKSKRYAISLIGAHQTGNAAAAIETAHALQKRGWAIPETAIHEGLISAKWNGRLEIVRDRPLCIIDGAHNQQAVGVLCEAIDSLLKNRRLITVMAMGADKPFDLCAPMLERRSARFIRTEIADTAQAVRQALGLAGPEDAVLACGSLHMIGGAKQVMLELT